MFLLSLLFALSIPVSAQIESPTELPEDFPEIHFSMNPFYNSRGFYWGRVLNVRRVRPVLSSYEGELAMGIGTSAANIVDRRCVELYVAANRAGNQQEVDQNASQMCSLGTNPWRFSFLDDSFFELLSQIKEVPVLIYYERDFWVPSQILTRTKNIIQRVYQTRPNLKIARSSSVSSWKRIQPESGEITGRIVKASLVHPVRKTYEIIIQESENANNFRAMSVRSGRLFRYITQAMLTGKLLRIEFMRLYSWPGGISSFIFNYKTDYRVISVTLVD